MSNMVAIVGRPNVGKSTLFNRLIQRRDAIVDSVAGVTRDRHYGHSDWNGKEFSVIDTGGYVEGSDDIFEAEIRRQVGLALEECDVIIFVVDVETGITDFDKEIANLLRKAEKPTLLAVNKVDSAPRENDALEFYGLGYEKLFNISSTSGSGTGDLLDELVLQFEEDAKEEDTEHLMKLAIVGRPNVGKSSIANALFEEERNIVTDIPGTTRDTVNTRFTKFGYDFMLLDTAGLRKKTRVNEDIEFYSVMRSIRTIEHADVCLLVLDATQGIESQDLSILSLIQKNSKGLVIVVNKWDLVEKETNTTKEFKEAIFERTAPFTDVDIIFTSAINKQRVLKVLEAADKVHERRTTKIPTSKLNDVMLDVFKDTPPPSIKGKYIKIKFCTQLPTHSPKFAFFANLPQYIKEPYRRFTENKLRSYFDLTGVPIEIFFRRK